MFSCRGVLTAILTLFGASALHAGMVCVMPDKDTAQQKCFAESGETVRLSPTGTERRAVWTADDSSSVTIFVVAPRQREFKVRPGKTGIDYKVSTRRLPRGARTLDFGLTDAAGRVWIWTMPGRVAGAQIHVPDGLYRLDVAAPQARTQTISGLRVVAGKIVDVGLIELKPKLAVEGRLVNETGVPIADAQLLAPDGRQLATTTTEGSFLIDEPSDQLPPFIMPRAIGYASEEIVIPDRRAPLDVGTVSLARGATLSVKVTFDDSSMENLHERVTVSLRRRPNGPAVAERSLEADSTVLLSGLASGKHVLLVRGPKSLQRYGEFVEIDASTHSTHEITISPVALSGYVYFGVEPLVGGSIAISPRNNTWSARETLGDDGEFGGVLWQRGAMAAIVEGGALRAPFVEDTEITSSDAKWDIVVPNRSFTGLVSDAKSGKGISGARVLYESIGTRMRLSSFVKTDSAGRYEITGVAQGSLQLRASAFGYLASEPVNVSVESHAPSREVPFVLRPGSLMTVRVVDDAGNPISGAVVIEGAEFGGNWTTRHETTPSGEVSIAVDHDQPKRVYVIPREGSFTTATLRDSETQPVTVVVPPGSCGLVINARSDDDGPITNVRFLVRYNGDLLPEMLWTMTRHYQGFDLVTDGTGTAHHPHLPSGLYELWPYGPAAEGRAMTGNPASAPLARVELTPGSEQIVTMKFAERKP